VCLDFPEFVEHIDIFYGSTEAQLEEGLRKFVQVLINSKVSIDVIMGDLNLPKVLNKYREDFGGSDQAIITFVFDHLIQQPAISLENTIRKICVS